MQDAANTVDNNTHRVATGVERDLFLSKGEECKGRSLAQQGHVAWRCVSVVKGWQNIRTIFLNPYSPFFNF